jgi:serine/threonine protein phosphatase PrpC
VLACDGIWDVMTNQDVVDFMSEKLGYTGKRRSCLKSPACDLLSCCF